MNGRRVEKRRQRIIIMEEMKEGKIKQKGESRNKTFQYVSHMRSSCSHYRRYISVQFTGIVLVVVVVVVAVVFGV